MPFTSSGTSAFTLVELLVVMAIIGILAAVMLPVLAAVRGTARQSQCMQTMRSAGQGFLLHANDNRDALPPAYDSVTRYSWDHSISKYLAAERFIFVCPMDAPAKTHANPQAPRSYSMNGGNDSTQGVAGRDWSLKLVQIPAPNKTLLLLEWHSVNNKGWNDSCAKLFNDASVTRTHSGKANYLFCDGHVEARRDAPSELYLSSNDR
ncbi:MAG: prepilin-type N-terminal cleavage/methylation domain-containing protein [Opitutaceae bacterium]|jgi:prepilin-type processing-associated H-X9-DG protein/prepilin-type N-terminal cleavage/methylation domain-containing protein|nr:prepilin-type N-terminal cleavage/methylation domain-containing protein [Opitutaceae bacterium]